MRRASRLLRSSPLLLFSQGSNVENDHYLVECKYTPTYWYRVYNDGWIEQGGKTTYTTTMDISSHNNVIFAKAFLNRPINFLYSDDQDWPSACVTRCNNITNSGFTITNDAWIDAAGINKIVTVSFYAAGF